MIQMSNYRKYLKPEPFLGAQRNLSRRLYRIQSQIVEKFPQGQARELMRRTIGRLLQGEATVQGKISQLMAVVDRLQGGDALTNDCTDEAGSVVRGSKWRENGPKRGLRGSLEDRGGNIGQVYLGQRFRTENYEASDEDYPSKISYSSRIPSPSPSPSNHFSKMPMHSSQKYPPNNPPASISASASQLYESINQKDIFSFRTQKEQQSPSIMPKNSPKNEGTPKGILLTRSKRSDRVISSHSRSKSSDGRSINYSSDNSPTKSKKSKKSPMRRSPKKSIYDGVSQAYTPRVKQSQKLSEIASKRLYKKITNRLKFSCCVLGKVEHAGSIPAQGILQNRVKLQQEVRTSLKKDIMDQVSASSIWKY